MSDTKAQAFQKRMSARAWYTSGRLIDWKCPTCGATGLDMHNVCPAALEVPCPGFKRTEELHAEFEKNYDTIVNS